MSENVLEPGMVVRVADPESFQAEFSKKIANRDAVVIWVGPDKFGQFNHRVKVRFQKRNGRGKEFDEIIHERHLEPTGKS